MVKKVGQRKFLHKMGYTTEELNKMSPGTAHIIISEEEKRRTEERNYKKQQAVYDEKKATAQAFAALMEDYLAIPSFICELIENKLIEGKYEEVIKYVIQRKKELKELDKNRNTSFSSEDGDINMSC